MTCALLSDWFTPTKNYKTNMIAAPTHIQAVKTENQTVRERVQNALGWTDLQYAEYQEQQGYRWLIMEIGDNPDTQKLIYNKLFWSWWINHYVKRDKAFLADFEHGKRKDILRMTYALRHNPKCTVFKSKYADQLQQSYGVLIGKLIKCAHYD